MPGDDVVTTEIVSIDICQEETTFNVYTEVDSTFPSGTICEDIAVYDFDVDNICDVEVDTECVFVDGSNTYYHLIPPSEEPEGCEVVVEYSCIVTNTRPKPHTVRDWCRISMGMITF